MGSYKVTLPCTRAEARELADVDFGEEGMQDNAPVIVTNEIDDQKPEFWEVHAYYSDKPSTDDIRILRTHLPSAANVKHITEKLGDEDWLTMSQSGLEPIRAGRFHVHTPQMPADNSGDMHNFCIDAGLAFGTGHHETTHGCLDMLCRIRRSGVRVDDMLDLGTGTGLLAFAAGHLWPNARLTASDIDAVCDDVVRENARQNDISLGGRRGEVEMVIADGLEHVQLIARAPYDLITANILAAPLIDMAPAITRSLAPRGHLILAGLLTEQADAVLNAYRWQDMMPIKRIVRGDWTILWLRSRAH